MAILHRVSNGNGVEVRMVPVSVAISALGICLTVFLTVLGFILGGRTAESRIAQRISVLESDAKLRDARLSSLVDLMEKRVVWGDQATTLHNSLDQRILRLEYKMEQVESQHRDEKLLPGGK